MGLLAKIEHVSKSTEDYDWIGEKLEKLFVEAGVREEQRWAKEQDWFRPSSLTYKWGAGQCARYWYYIFNHYDRHSKSDSLGVARMGHGTHRHEVLQEKFGHMDEFVEIERELKLESPTLRGSCDLVLEVGGEEVIGEIKTTKQETWFKRKLEGPPFYNVIQLCLYMYMAGTKRGFLLIENNNTLEVLLFPVYLDDGLQQELEQLFEWMREVEYTIKQDGLLPERCFTKSTNNCKGCPFKQQCWDGPDGSVKLPRNPIYGSPRH